MKKRRFLALLATVLLLATGLTACGKDVGTVSSLDKVLNPDYDVSETVWKEAVAVAQLDGYSYEKSAGDVALFSQFNSRTDLTTYAVFNFKTEKVILSLTEKQNTQLLIDFSFAEYGMIHVEEVDVQTAEFTHWQYDTAGNEILKQKSLTAKLPQRLGDMIVYDRAAYSLDRETGALTKVMDVPEHLYLKEQDLIAWNEDYYYFSDNSTVFVYDKELNFVSTWSAPSYAQSKKIRVLNDGTVLAQYRCELSEDAKEFDFYQNNNARTQKYDLITLLISPKNARVKEIDLKYVVVDVISETAAHQSENGEAYGESFDNLATVYPIVNQRVDESAAARDLVLFSNSGTVRRSLKLVEGQTAALPEKLEDDVYILPMLDGGAAILNLKGDVLVRLNSFNEDDWRQAGHYFVTDSAIYNLSLERVLDLRETETRVLYAGKNLILLREGTDESYTVYAFQNGEKTKLYTYLMTDASTESFETVPGLGYCIGDGTKYHYYNENCEEIFSTPNPIKALVTTENRMLVSVETIRDGFLTMTYMVIKK